MATGVSLINKDILRYFQTQNLLAPPEAIELTKLYNEMSDLLKKPVKYQDQAIQLHLFYDLLSQYGQHLNNLKLASSETIPDVPKPPSIVSKSISTQTETATPSKETRKRKSDSSILSTGDSSKTVVSQPSTPSSDLRQKVPPKASQSVGDDDVFVDLQPSSIPDSPKSDINEFAKTIDPDSDVPNTVMNALKENDSTFQIFPESNEIMIQGRKISGAYLKNILSKLKNPEYRLQSRPNIADPHQQIVVNKIMNAVQTMSESFRRKHVFAKLPGLQNAIAHQAKSSRKPFSSDPIPSAYESPTTSQATAPPQRLPIGKGKRKKSKYAVVNWNRWQKHLQAL
jgi:hypothetical protein